MRSSHIQTRQSGFSEKQEKTKYGQDAYQGPWTVTHINNNGTVKIKKGKHYPNLSSLLKTMWLSIVKPKYIYVAFVCFA